MIFTSNNIRLIERMLKTQTRRLSHPLDSLKHYPDGGKAVVRDDRVMWKVGSDYAVQPGRGKESVARIRIIDIRREMIGAISADDAVAEGCESQEDFFALWWELHGEKFDLARTVWVLTFVFVGRDHE